MSSLNLNQLQKEVYEWSMYNFGDQSPENPLMGLIEEVGELAHAVLKTRQSIRAIETGAIEDAVGDIVIYLMDYTARMDFEVKSVIYAKLQSSVPRIAARVGQIAEYFEKHYPLSNSIVYALIDELQSFCVQNRIDFEYTVSTTWNEVKQRDWKKFPTNGRTK